MNPINFSTSPAIYGWKPAAWLRVTGDDAANFLQGQFTNELRGLVPGGCVYGLWLNVKGKVLADSFVLRGSAANEFWVGSYFSPAATIQARLESHVIADDVTIEDRTAEWSAVTRWGGDGEGVQTWGPLEGFVFAGRRGEAPSVEWVFPVSRLNEVREKISDVSELTAAEVTRRRIAAGIPAIPLDLGTADLPNEAALETEAISYTKGCYLGQEVMARLKAMGQVRRRLLRVRGPAGALPAVPAPLFAGERQAGELRSVAAESDGAWIGLAMISLLHLSSDGLVALAPGAAATVRVIDRP